MLKNAFWLLIGAAVLLSACDGQTYEELLADGWIYDEDEKDPAYWTGPLYCYSTIGEEDCHNRPLPDESNRLVGYQGPPPELLIED